VSSAPIVNSSFRIREIEDAKLAELSKTQLHISELLQGDAVTPAARALVDGC
jgi:hypothetical protein